MTYFKIEGDVTDGDRLPAFSLTIDDTGVTSLYSTPDIQDALVNVLQNDAHVTVCDQQEGLYQRLSVEDNIKFFHRWFGCNEPVPELLVQFNLQHCAKTPMHQCTASQERRVYFAKYYMNGFGPLVFREPIQGMDVKTVDLFMNMLQRLMNSGAPVLVLVSNMEHAVLLGDHAYKLQEHTLEDIEVDDGEEQASAPDTSKPETAKLYKIPAKVDDKTILFDPPEIDYIESQDGKAMIVINDEAYAMDATLADIQKRLEVYGFYRCHRSYIVNLQKVREIITWSKNTYSLRINNRMQSTIPLSRAKIQDIQDKFSL